MALDAAWVKGLKMRGAFLGGFKKKSSNPMAGQYKNFLLMSIHL